MSRTGVPTLDDRFWELATPNLLRLQLAFSAIVAVVVVTYAFVDIQSWAAGPGWLSAICIVGAAALSLVARQSKRSIEWLPIAVLTADMIAIIALRAGDHAPGGIAMLAVVPAYWLGGVARAWGMAIAGIGGVAMALLFVLEKQTEASELPAEDIIAALIVPLGLIFAAWSGQQYARTVVRQQRSLIRREHEKADLGRRVAADAAVLDAIFDTARVGLVLLDPDGSIVRVNAPISDHPGLGSARPEGLLQGAPLLELESRKPIPASQHPLRRAARGEAFDEQAFWFQLPDEETVAVSMSSRPLVLGGELRGSIASLDDVTTYMRMLEDRDEFVALVSHELRTPLTSIAGYLEFALDGEVHADLRSLLEIAQRNADRLQVLVDDLLSVGQLNRGELRLEPTTVDLRALADAAIGMLEPRARGRDVRLQLLEGPAVEVEADARRINQVIENLVSNGIKYSHEQGTVRVRVDVEGADALVEVVDDGEGMLPSEAGRVFEQFYRSAAARISGAPGAGLGLWISRAIIDAHGGSISFASAIGEGSTASFRLPRSH